MDGQREQTPALPGEPGISTTATDRDQFGLKKYGIGVV